MGFIPFNLSIDLDGISGVKIYNKLKTDSKFLPSNYPKTLEFIVKQANHSISNNVWTTSLETLAVPISKPNLLKDPKEFERSRGEIPIFFEPVIGMPIRNDEGGGGDFDSSRIRTSLFSQGKALELEERKEAHQAYDILTLDIDEKIASIGSIRARQRFKQFPQGTEIYSPIDGILRIGSYRNFKTFTIEGTGVFDGISVKLLYVNPLKNNITQVRSGDIVGQGKLIGYSVNLSDPNNPEAYPTNVKDHVHFSVTIDGQVVNPNPKAGVIKYITRI